MTTQSNMEMIISPPVVPNEAPQCEEWGEIERKLGIALPTDYKYFLERYGSGRIDEFISIFNPNASNKFLNFNHQIEEQLNVIRELKAEGSEVVPFEIFPAEGGLLPFGKTDNGDVLFWVTVGQADTWSVAVNASRSPEWQVFSCGMVEFLSSILRKHESCSIFPNDFPSDTPIFVPYRP
jgi:hypothetical protein